MCRWVLKTFFFFFVFSVFMPMPPAAGKNAVSGGHFTLSAPGVVVYYPEGLHRAAVEVADFYPDIRAAAEGVFGWGLGETVSIALVGRSSLFEMYSGSPGIAAYAVPRRNLIVVDHQKLQSHPLSLRSVVTHELVHLILHEHIPDGLLPRWFEEGICQWVGDGLREASAGGRRAIDLAAARGDLIPFRLIERSFPRDPEMMALAYQQSKSLVTYLVANYGRESLIGILELMKSGRDYDSAVENVLGIPARDLEEEWRGHLSGAVAWIRVVAQNLHGLVFSFAAVVAAIGFVRVVVKRRRALRDYGDED